MLEGWLLVPFSICKAPSHEQQVGLGWQMDLNLLPCGRASCSIATNRDVGEAERDTRLRTFASRQALEEGFVVCSR